MNTQAATIPPQPGALACSEVLVLPEGGAFSFSAAFQAETTRPDQAPALAAFVFLDADGTALDGQHPGFAHSERFGPFVYLGDKGQAGAVRVNLALQAPPRARQVALHLHRWGAAQVRVTGELGLAGTTGQAADPAQPQVEDVPAPLWEGGIALQAAGPVTLSALIDAAGSDDSRAPLVAALAFQDAGGSTLPGPFPGSFHSERFGPFVYLGEKGRPEIQLAGARIVPPPGAAHLTVRLYRWAGAVQLLEPAELQQIVVMEPGQVICSVEAEIGEGEPVTVRFSAACQAPLAEGVLLVRPVFLDAAGQPLEPFGEVPVSPRIGAYRYLEPEAGMAPEPEPGRAAASIGFLTPAGTVRMRAEIVLWKETQPLSALRAELIPASRAGGVSAEGRLALRPIYRSLSLAGQIRATGRCGPRSGGSNCASCPKPVP